MNVEPLYQTPNDPRLAAYEGSKERNRVFGLRRRFATWMRQVAEKCGVLVQENEGTEWLQQYRADDYRQILQQCPEVSMPPTLSLRDYKEQPFFPAILKDRTAFRGANKFLVTSRENLTLVLNQLPSKRHCNFDVQEFIECPSDRFTSFRVLVSAKGTFLGGGLSYSGHTKEQMFETHVPLHDASLFGAALREQPCVVSNSVDHGGYIPLSSCFDYALSRSEKRTMSAHDLLDDALPSTLLLQSQQIAASILRCRSTIDALFLGMDWVQHKNDLSRFSLLEVNKRPSPYSYAMHAISEPENSRVVRRRLIVRCLNELRTGDV